MASIQYVVNATDAASRVFAKIAASADGLDRQLADLSKRVATPEVDLKDAKFTLGMVNAAKRLDKLSAMVADPKVEVDAAKAQTEILRITAMLDRLDHKRVTATVTVRQRLAKAAGAGFLQPSALGAAAALSPALIPIAAGLSGAVAGIAASFGAAAAGAGAFGLLAKTALTQASTAAGAVTTAQDQYKVSLIAIRQQYAANAAAAKTHAQKAAALATEQKALTAAGIAQTKAINLAYADMTPKQIALSKAIGGMQNAWMGVQQATAPVISGALVPWIRDVTLLMKDLAPLIRPVADLFGYWGRVLHRYLSSGAGSTEIGKIADELGRFSATQLSAIINFFVDAGKGVANLARDIAGHNVDFYAFGKHLQGWGDAFARWSGSKAARDDVGAFLRYIRDNGGRLITIVKDFAKFVPGIFAGASTAGTLELQALTSFLTLLDKLPPSVARPLTEIAGAMLLLSKTGVVKVGLKLTGKLAENPAAFGFTLGAVLAGAIIAGVNSKRPGHGGQTWWQSFGPPSKAQQQTWLNSWAGLGDRIVQIADDVRHGVATVWDHLWNHTLATTRQGDHDIAAEFDRFRHSVAATWDRIWATTVAQVRGGIGDVVRWFQSLPGRVLGALRGLGHSLYAFGHAALSDFLNGLKAVGGTVLGWLRNFIGGIPHAIMSFLHMSPPHAGSVFYDLGANLMHHLEAGIKSTAHKAVAAAQATAHRVAAAGAGVQRWAPLVSRALAMEGLSPRLLGNVLFQMQTESGGNPNAINLTDINARMGDPSRGLMQVIGSTFAAYHWPGTSGNIYDPLANIAAALNYARHRYGPSLMSGGMGIGSGHGYALGGVITEPITGFGRSGQMYTFGERGPETVIPGLPGRGHGGPVVQFGDVNIRTEADLDLLSHRLGFAIAAAGLGGG